MIGSAARYSFINMLLHAEKQQEWAVQKKILVGGWEVLGSDFDTKTNMRGVHTKSSVSTDGRKVVLKSLN